MPRLPALLAVLVPLVTSCGVDLRIAVGPSIDTQGGVGGELLVQGAFGPALLDDVTTVVGVGAEVGADVRDRNGGEGAIEGGIDVFLAAAGPDAAGHVQVGFGTHSAVGGDTSFALSAQAGLALRLADTGQTCFTFVVLDVVCRGNVGLGLGLRATWLFESTWRGVFTLPLYLDVVGYPGARFTGAQ